MGIREAVETDFNNRSRIGRSTAVNDVLVKQSHAFVMAYRKISIINLYENFQAKHGSYCSSVSLGYSQVFNRYIPRILTICE